MPGAITVATMGAGAVTETPEAMGAAMGAEEEVTEVEEEVTGAGVADSEATGIEMPAYS